MTIPLRPLEAITAMEWAPEGDADEPGALLMQAYDIQLNELTDCYVCHR